MTIPTIYSGFSADRAKRPGPASAIAGALLIGAVIALMVVAKTLHG